MAEEFQINNIADPKLYGTDPRLQRFYSWLREEHPVARAEPEGYRPFWVVSRHADIREIERRSDIFNAGPRVTLLPISVEQANKQTFGIEAGIYSLVMMDGARHQEMRGLTQSLFLPKNIRKIEDLIRTLARQFVDRLDGLGGECDLGMDLAFWYPLRVAMMILGIDEADEALLLKLTHELFGGSDPEIIRPGITQAEHLVAVHQDYKAFFDKITQDRRANPREDVATLIANGRPGGKDMTAAERMGYYIIIATAGHDTTASTIAGGLKALMDHPEQMAALRRDRSFLKTFSNEAVRWTAPVKHFFRTVAEDYMLHGECLRKGDHVMLSYGAATRDSMAIQDADRFQFDRMVNNHLAFGYGPHMCLGQFLARMEIEAFFDALLDKVDHIEPAGPPIYTEAPFVSGIRCLPIRYALRQ